MTTRAEDDARLEALREDCRRLPGVPGVYRMIDARETVIYVGKARDLKKRVSSYFMRLTGHSPKVAAMVRQAVRFEVVVTRNENEALLLESNLIKELKPRYNIVLRDDKSYPYIYVTTDQPYPRLAFHRGAKSGKGRYFGPYPNAGAVRGTINLLQKLFMLRHCQDSFFANRARPCLQYQIKRCTAPCVDLVAADEYRADVEHAILFLEGNSQQVIEVLVKGMEEASAKLEFERAARYRDQIAKLQRVASEQHVDSDAGDFDIIVCRLADGVGCVQVFFVRGGRTLGNKTYFPAHTGEASTAEILEAFLPQFYLTGHAERDIPSDIILAETIEDEEWLATALAERRGGAVRFRHNVRGERARWLEMAQENAELALTARLTADADQAKRIEALRDALDLPELPNRIECFDVSHTRGEATVASCVVFGPEGARKADYRRFNIEGVAAGDDYAAMRQALERRYGRLQREEAQMPDLLLIDGGKGQVAQALEVLAELQIDEITVVGVAKGTTRKPGLEKLIMHDGTTERAMPPESLALHLIQQIRDEAHRFAITAHRRARSRARGKSPLQDIAGIGATRRQRLIQHFGGMQGVVRASVEDLQRVPGISRQLAQTIYDVLHD
ncbi:MAG: excinuclease ABC subunit UvrC [Gammaproteobacteria bacterium]|nr:excinuclease ABC subunit UvrC [Gammaproteobacteria bacterium]MBI5616076.1 excinuclease ABC subunit UvrC [Gammaproteobacteria bacterium]